MEYYSKNSNHLHELIKPLETKYENYAYPNNYEFEKMNAGIIQTLSLKYPKLTPLDDVLRCPVYEDLSIIRNKKITEEQNIMATFVAASKEVLKPIPFMPEDWTVEEYIKIHKSSGAEKIREIIHTLKSEPNLTQNKLEKFLQDMDNLSKNLSPTKSIIYSIGGLTAGTAGAVASIAIPWLFAASIGGAAVSAAQLIEGINELSKKHNLNWLNLAKQIAKWN